MSTTIPSRLDEPTDPSAAGAERSEPGGRAKRGAGIGRRVGRPELAAELKALLPDELLDELLAGARTEEEITGPSSGDRDEPDRGQPDLAGVRVEAASERGVPALA